MLRLVPLIAAAFGALIATSHPASAAPCADADYRTRVTGGDECLATQTYQHINGPEAPVLYVFLHGDQSDGGPVASIFQVAQDLIGQADANAVAVAMLRPGYADAQGNRSGGSDCGRRDCYTDGNIDAIGQGIAALKATIHPRRTVIVGHSGGAAITGVLLGRAPGLADAALLVSCPCDISAWRSNRGKPWTSESPSGWIDRIPQNTRVSLIVGSKDDNTRPALSQDYRQRLVRRGIPAELTVLDGKTHNSAFRAPEVVTEALKLGR